MIETHVNAPQADARAAERGLPLGALSPERLADYERDGFLVLPDFVDPAACDALRARGIELANECDPSAFLEAFASYGKGPAYETDKAAAQYAQNSGDKMSVFLETGAFDSTGKLLRPKEQGLNKIAHALHDCEPLFGAFSRAPHFEALVQSLGLLEPLIAQSMYMFKQPDVGAKIDIHQDATFIYTEPSTVVGIWTALEDATVENGCMWALPGGHRLGLKARYVRTDEGDKFVVLDGTGYSEKDFVPLPAKKGTVVVLHGLLPHMSGPNTSRRSRHAYTFHLIDGAVPYAPENWLQRPASNPFRGFR